jgi:hypothetical protein
MRDTVEDGAQRSLPDKQVIELTCSALLNAGLPHINSDSVRRFVARNRGEPSVGPQEAVNLLENVEKEFGGLHRVNYDIVDGKQELERLTIVFPEAIAVRHAISSITCDSTKSRRVMT